MNIMVIKNYLIIIIIILITSIFLQCDNSHYTDSKKVINSMLLLNEIFSKEYIWNDESQKIEITYYNWAWGETPKVYNYNRSELNSDQLNILRSIYVIDPSQLSCWMDGSSYSIKIYKSDGSINEYGTNGSACGEDALKNKFVDYSAITNFLNS